MSFCADGAVLQSGLLLLCDACAAGNLDIVKCLVEEFRVSPTRSLKDTKTMLYVVCVCFAHSVVCTML